MTLARMARFSLLLLMVTLLLFGTLPATAAETNNSSFQRTWARTDLPVQEDRVDRTWMWGPGAFTAGLLEDYQQSPGGQRVVQYFDKSRMEINNPDADRASNWYVTNGLLARELITGAMQVGDNAFVQRSPANVHVAGDPDPAAPTYAAFSKLMSYAPIPQGWTLIQTVDAAGNVGADDSLAGYGVSAAVHVPETNHMVASVFWDFMTSQGMVYENGSYHNGQLFESVVYATGLPLTEAYWTTVRVDGNLRQVLVQVFERRVLTYTPDNPEGWRVEAGNVGRHYYSWRYAGQEPVPAPVPEAPVIVLDPGHDANSGGALGNEYQYVMRTALFTKTVLENAGYTVYLTRPDNGTLLYGDPALMPPNAATMDAGYNQGYAHTTRALELQPDLYISLHYNAAGSSAVGGMTTYYCDFGGGQNRVLAEIVTEELLSAMRSVGYEPPYAQASEDGSIGKVYGHLATLGNVYSAPFAFESNRLAGIPAVLTEPLFMTNPAELALIEQDATHQAFAAAYLRAVDRYFGR